MKYLILALFLAVATVAHATNNGNDDCPGNSCHAGGDASATGGQGGDATAIGTGVGFGGSAKAEGGDATAIGVGGQGGRGGEADSRSTSSSKSDADAVSVSGSQSKSGAVSVNGGNNLSIDDHSKSTWTEVSDAPSAPGASAATDNICGNVTGVSAGIGIAGGGISKPSFECHVHKHLLFQAAHAGEPSARLELVLFWVTALPQAVFAVAF